MHCRRTCGAVSILCRSDDPDLSNTKRLRPIDSNVFTRNIAFFRAHYTTKNMPKCVLHSYAMKKGLDKPIYITKQKDRLFQTVISFQNKKYVSSYWEKNKKFAEQGAALVCILDLGLVKEDDLYKNGSLVK